MIVTVAAVGGTWLTSRGVPPVNDTVAAVGSRILPVTMTGVPPVTVADAPVGWSRWLAVCTISGVLPVTVTSASAGAMISLIDGVPPVTAISAGRGLTGGPFTPGRSPITVSIAGSGKMWVSVVDTTFGVLPVMMIVAGSTSQISSANQPVTPMKSSQSRHRRAQGNPRPGGTSEHRAANPHPV